MSDFGINDMLEMQKSLQEKYKDIWKPRCRNRGILLAGKIFN